MASVRGRSIQLRLWAAFLVGCTVGGTFTGTVLGIFSGLLTPVPFPIRAAVFGLLAVTLTVMDLRQVVLRLPQRKELIPQEVFARGMGRGGFRFGVEYGCGFRTLVPSAASYVAAVFILLAGLPLIWAVCLGAAFGASRSVAVLQYVLLGRTGWQQFLASHTRWLERGGTVLAAVLLAWAVLSLLG